MAHNLTPKEREIVSEILQAQIPEARVWLFGSRAQGTARKTSDLDILIHDQQPLSLTDLSNLRLAFSESFLPFTIDIVDAQTIEKEFYDKILPSCELFQEGTSN